MHPDDTPTIPDSPVPEGSEATADPTEGPITEAQLLAQNIAQANALADSANERARVTFENTIHDLVLNNRQKGAPLPPQPAAPYKIRYDVNVVTMELTRVTVLGEQVSSVTYATFEDPIAAGSPGPPIGLSYGNGIFGVLDDPFVGKIVTVGGRTFKAIANSPFSRQYQEIT